MRDGPTHNVRECGAVNIADPIEGSYRRRMVRGGVWVPVRIWIEDGDRDDAGYLMSDQIIRCTLAGEAADPFAEWLHCCDQPISKAEHDYLLAVLRHAAEHAPHMPEAQPRRPIDLNSMAPLF